MPCMEGELAQSSKRIGPRYSLPQGLGEDRHFAHAGESSIGNRIDQGRVALHCMIGLRQRAHLRCHVLKRQVIAPIRKIGGEGQHLLDLLASYDARHDIASNRSPCQDSSQRFIASQRAQCLADHARSPTDVGSSRD